MIENYVKTHIGQRDLNEDRYLVDEELGLYIVADGVGGLDKGEVASKLTCELIHKNIKQGQSLVESVEAAHQYIITDLETNKQNAGMASTVVALKFSNTDYEIAWVGDSRVYLWDGELKLLTRDHSYLELLFVAGQIGIDDFKNNPNKNVISQAIGIEKEFVDVSTNKGTLEKNQVLLMATDGLYEVVREKKIIERLVLNAPIEKLTVDLVDCAVDLGGKDNITLMALKSNAVHVDKKGAIKADVVRKFNAETGKATEIKEDITNQSKVANKVSVNSIKPKNLSDLGMNDKEKKKGKFKLIELLLLILIIIAATVIYNLI